MMKRGLGLGILTAALLGVGGVSPAHADVGGSLGSPGLVVAYDDCRAVAAPYAFWVPAGTEHWDVTLTTIKPDGTHGPGDYIYIGEDPTTGSAALQFCGGEMPGAYTLAASGEYTTYDPVTHDDVDHAITFPSTTFTVRLPQTRTTLKKRVKRGKSHLTVSVMDERPAGYFPTRYADLQLQLLSKRHKWINVSHTRVSTHANGQYNYSLGRVRRAAKLRVVTLGDATEYVGSISNTVTVH